jgi:hypothetical protein
MTMKIKTSELTGAALDWAVAQAEGFPIIDVQYKHIYINGERGTPFLGMRWIPSTDWAQGGPIIERKKIGVEWQSVDKRWTAALCYDRRKDMWSIEYGPTPLIAAMRCHVASKLGDEVEIPEELCK